jgi:hypothetical protein
MKENVRYQLIFSGDITDAGTPHMQRAGICVDIQLSSSVNT